MPVRTATIGQTSPSRSEIAGSVFDHRQPPRLPAGLPADVRRQARDVFSSNPHLWDPTQVEPVVRLARLRCRFLEIEAKVTADGYLFEHERKGTIPHPLLTPMTSTASAILQLERALCLVAITKSGQVKQHETVLPATTPTVPKTSAGPTRTRPLMLA